MKYFNTPGNCIVQAKVNTSVSVLKIDRVLKYYVDRYGKNVTAPPCYSLTPGVEVVMFNKSTSETWDYFKTEFVKGGEATQDCGAEPNDLACVTVKIDPLQCSDTISLNLVCPTKYVVGSFDKSKWSRLYPKGSLPPVTNGSFSVRAIDLNVTDCQPELQPVPISPRQRLKNKPKGDIVISDFQLAITYLKSDEFAEIVTIILYVILGVIVFTIFFITINCFYLSKWCIVQEVSLKGIYHNL